MCRALIRFALLSATLAFAACGDDNSTTPPIDEQQPRTFEVELANVGQKFALSASGLFDRAAGAQAPGPLMPGQAFEVQFLAPHGWKLSFATMFAESNDYFYAPGPEGIPLWDANNQPLTGDKTDQLMLWDAGTELDQEPGLGPDQAPRQAAPNSGAADPDPTVRLAEDEFGNLPDVAQVIRATISYAEGYFTLRIENVSHGTTLQTSDGMSKAVPLSPGAFLVHLDPGQLFMTGSEDKGEGLEAIAEDGAAQTLGAALAAKVGLTVPISPGVFATSKSSSVLFTPGQADRGEGLEAIAEDGMAEMLAASLESRTDLRSDGKFDTPVGSSMKMPAMPGQAYRFTITAAPGDRLHFATMFVPSNDYFFAPDQTGIELFDAGGDPLNVDVTAQVKLWDLGTEVDQELGMGNTQAPFQATPNFGPAENATVGEIENNTPGMIRVRIAPQGQLPAPG